MKDSRTTAVVEQDSAILDYLDSLLREPGSPSSSHLTLVDVQAAEAEAAASGDLPEPAGAMVQEGVNEDADMAETLSNAEMETPEATLESAAEPDGEPEAVVADAPAEPVAEHDQPESAEASEAVATTEAMPEPEASAAATDLMGGAVAAEADSDAYVVVTVGTLKLAFLASEVVDVVEEPVLEPVRGAPAHIAGGLQHGGKRRMILSLAQAVTGRAADQTAASVLMLGQGLWGAAGGPVETGVHIPPGQVKWRSPTERSQRRPWLVGLNREDGMAIVDTTALKSVLTGKA